MKLSLSIIIFLVAGFVSAQAEHKEKEDLKFSSEQEKVEWIKNHPEEYKKLNNGQLPNGERFSSQEEKEKWIKENPEGIIIKKIVLSQEELNLAKGKAIQELEEEIEKNRNNPNYDLKLKSQKLKQAKEVQSKRGSKQ
ncbi:MAG: hypothetical protein COA33_003290 [Fluviicola sp.]|nr:hypothetical protein [Fluviicola sp.]